MAYPVSLDELTDGVPSDGTAAATSLGDATYQHDDHHRALAVAVEAVEAELGTAPSGASATVAARFGTLTNDVFTGGVSFGGGISLTGTSSVAARKITMQGTQAIYMPDQAAFAGCFFFGNGGGSLAAGAIRNTGCGLDALGAVTTGADNTAVGTFSLTAVTSGSENVGLGAYALVNLTTGGSNVAVGRYTGVGIVSGGGNTIIGSSITGLAAGAASLTLVGYQAGVSTTATSLTAVGNAAGSTSSGANSTLVGDTAGAGQTGIDVTAVGLNAGNGNTGGYSTFIGKAAGLSNTAVGVICLGRGAVATANSQLVVGSADVPANYWHPGHDMDTYLDIATPDTVKHYAGGQKVLEVNATGGAPYLGFFGTAAVAKPTGVAVSAAGIHSALVTLGLIAA